jgi:type I restriction enzyme, S subunit
MAHFPKKPLGEMLSFYNGKAIKPGGIGEFPVYGANGIIGGDDEYKYCEGIIIGRVGAYCGSVQYCPGKFWASDNTIVAKPKTDNQDVRFLYYLLGALNLNNYAGGAAQPLVTQAVLKQVEAFSPSLSTQWKIAALLSAYDNLIENNLRRIKILEEMAQNLYREWFVKFRFPGHQNARFTDSPLGSIPEGWEVAQLGEVADVRWGDTSTTKSSYVSDGYTAYSAAGADGALDHYDYDRDGIVLSAIGANCGLTWFASGKWSCIKNTIRLWSSNPRVSTEYLYYATLGKDFWPKRGAAQPFISQGDAKEIAIVVPEKDINRQFEEFIKQTLAQNKSLSKKNITLRRTRDLLLPKLISGEVDVSGLDIAVPEETGAP